MEATVDAPPELPEDLLMGVFASLEIPDLVRASAVCTSWRSAYTTLRDLSNHKQPQTPCLLYTSESAGENVACLYSLVEKRVYRLNLPEPPIRSRHIIGSSLGLLVTVDERPEMHLVNPITGQQTALPSVLTFDQVQSVYYDCDESTRRVGLRILGRPHIFDPASFRDFFHRKALVFPDASTAGGSFIVVLIHGPYDQLSFARAGDDKWTSLPRHTGYQDCTYKDGLLYAVTLRAEVHAYDLTGPIVTMNIIKGDEEGRDIKGIYILQPPWGGMLLVWRSRYYADPETRVMNTTAIEVHQVDAATGRLVEIDCLDGHALFLGHNQSVCLGTKEYPSLKGNHAYLTDDHDWIVGRKNDPRYIGVHDMDSNNSKEYLASPQLYSNWPAPVWITPNLTMMKPTWPN
ncbi:unnamed protein product [Alopecurus aequalis]